MGLVRSIGISSGLLVNAALKLFQVGMIRHVFDGRVVRRKIGEIERLDFNAVQALALRAVVASSEMRTNVLVVE
jgi:hypothetical protein